MIDNLRCETIQSVCTNNTCSNHGVCYIDASSGNNTVRCVCIQGYTGQHCQVTINSLNLCSQNPCGYNGTCLSTSNSSYYCICPNGLTGQSCTSSKHSYYNKKKQPQNFVFFKKIQQCHVQIHPVIIYQNVNQQIISIPQVINVFVRII